MIRSATEHVQRKIEDVYPNAHYIHCYAEEEHGLSPHQREHPDLVISIPVSNMFIINFLLCSVCVYKLYVQLVMCYVQGTGFRCVCMLNVKITVYWRIPLYVSIKLYGASLHVVYIAVMLAILGNVLAFNHTVYLIQYAL